MDTVSPTESESEARQASQHSAGSSLRIVDLPAGDPRWPAALAVLQELRPHLTSELLNQVLTRGTPQGLRFTAVVDGEEVLAVAGWRVMDTTSVIRKIYVDDLVTTQAARSRGCGRLLLQHLARLGRQWDITRIELDSGVQRHAAHRFYLRERYDIVSHHFGLNLD